MTTVFTNSFWCAGFFLQSNIVNFDSLVIKCSFLLFNTGVSELLSPLLLLSHKEVVAVLILYVVLCLIAIKKRLLRIFQLNSI